MEMQASSLTFFKSFFLNNDLQPQSRSTTIPFSLSPTPLLDVSMDEHPLASDRSITTRLPLELWFLIFRFATYPPFPWSSPSPISSYSPSHHHHHSHQISTTTLPFHIRLANYTSELKWKASLTRVCKEWNIWGQDFLWENLWIASGKDGKALVALVCGHRGHVTQGRKKERQGQPVGTNTSSVTVTVGKEKKKKVGFVLKRVRNSSDSKSSVALALTTPTPSPLRRKNIASYIKKLHIETPSMDKCCPIDLTSILERCERLEVLIDLRSVRSGFGVVGVGMGVGGRGLDCKGPPIKSNATRYSQRVREVVSDSGHHHRISNSTSDPILRALPQQKSTLKHLTFTNYKYDPDDPQGGVWFWEDIVGGALTSDNGGLGATLESLEVVMSTRGVGMGFNGYGYPRNPGSSRLSRRLEAGLLTSLDININSSLFPSASNHNQPLSFSLPSLHSLRIPLTSPTLLVISTWALPSLQSLSVVSIDFTGWRRMGFKEFMDVHGGRLVRFEIVGGGESGEEEGWITEREDALYGTASNLRQQQNLHLPSTSPHLKQFICSSNASEWNWETPDWIAPHVLMPEHFGVERIGVWGLEGKVVRGGGAYYERFTFPTVGGRRRTISTWTTSHSTISDDSFPYPEDDEDEQYLLEEQPFFMLQEQFGSLLRREAFPALVCIRDMSWESDLIRRSVGIGCGLTSSYPEPETMSNTKKKPKGLKTLASSVASRLTASFTTATESSSSSSAQATFVTSQTQSYKIRKFWLGVLEMCDRRGVYLEDWMGRRVVA